MVLYDSTAPATPTVGQTANPSTSVYQAANGATIYYRPDVPVTITLTSTGINSISGIGSSTFDPLSGSTGWTYTSGNVPGNPVQKNLIWTPQGANATLNSVTLPVKTTTNAGKTSLATTITLTPDASAPLVSFV